MDALPLVLLGIRTTLKQDISSTVAEMVHDTTLHLPGEFFTPSPTTFTDPSTCFQAQIPHANNLTFSSPALLRATKTSLILLFHYLQSSFITLVICAILTFLTLGAHAQKRYCSPFVCLSVCLSICLSSL